MKAPIKQAWIDALRSGDYGQAQEVLLRYDGMDGDTPMRSFCCLGVLTDLCIRSGEMSGQIMYDPNDPARVLVATEQGDEPDEVIGDIGWTEFADNDLSPIVAEWAGITSRGNGDRTYNPMLNGRPAIQRNDEDKQTFEQIADAIEKDVTL